MSKNCCGEAKRFRTASSLSAASAVGKNRTGAGDAANIMVRPLGCISVLSMFVCLMNQLLGQNSVFMGRQPDIPPSNPLPGSPGGQGRSRVAAISGDNGHLMSGRNSFLVKRWSASLTSRK